MHCLAPTLITFDPYGHGVLSKVVSVAALVVMVVIIVVVIKYYTFL